jgi:hypothetical protein
MDALPRRQLARNTPRTCSAFSFGTKGMETSRLPTAFSTSQPSRSRNRAKSSRSARSLGTTRNGVFYVPTCPGRKPEVESSSATRPLYRAAPWPHGLPPSLAGARSRSAQRFARALLVGPVRAPHGSLSMARRCFLLLSCADQCRSQSQSEDGSFSTRAKRSFSSMMP